MPTGPDYKKAALWGAAFGVAALLIQKMVGATLNAPNSVAYFGGGALMGALAGVALTKVRSLWRR